jgi:hypothetical protein
MEPTEATRRDNIVRCLHIQKAVAGMTLAQEYLERGEPYKTPSPELNDLIGWTHQLHTQPAACAAFRANGDAERTAERYVFDDPPQKIVADLVKAGQLDRQTMLSTIHLPQLNMWIEMPIRFNDRSGGVVEGRFGAMVGRVKEEETSEEKTVMAVTVKSSRYPFITPIALIQMPALPVPVGTKAHYNPYYLGFKSYNALGEAELGELDRFLNDFADALFLLTLPRAVEYREASFGPRKEKVQARTGKPFIEFRRVHIRIGEAVGRYSGASGEAGTGEGGRYKLHRVGPFLRTYRKGRDTPRIVLLDQFWRGNPEKGVIIKEKHYHGK